MKNIVVFLLYSLLFVFACQLVRSISSKHPSHHIHKEILSVTPPLYHHRKHEITHPMYKRELVGQEENESFLSITSLMSVVNVVIGSVGSIPTGFNSITSSFGSIASFIQYAIDWILVPFQIAEFILQIIICLCGVSFLAPLVPVVTRATMVMALTLLFVPFEALKGHAIHLFQESYNLIRPLLVKFIPNFEFIESAVIMVYGTTGVIIDITKSTSESLYSGSKNVTQVLYNYAIKSLAASYMTADNIGQKIQTVANTVTQLAAVAVDMAANTPKFVKEVSKEVMHPTQYTAAQLEDSKQALCQELYSLRGTSPMPPPSLMPRKTSGVPAPSTNVTENIVSRANYTDLEPSGTLSKRRMNLSSRSKNNTGPKADSSEPAYLDLSNMPKLYSTRV